jgi:hypothetical protein
MPSVIMLNVVMTSVVIPITIMQNVVTPSVVRSSVAVDRFRNKFFQSNLSAKKEKETIFGITEQIRKTASHKP